MKLKLCLFLMILLFTAAESRAQNQGQVADPLGNISVDISRIAAAVHTLNERLKAFVDKLAAAEGLSGALLSRDRRRPRR